MTTTWKPDTCDCELEYDENLKFIACLNCCRLHEIYEEQDLLDEVIKHNQGFNLKLGRIEKGEWVETKLKTISDGKKAERERISRL